MNDNIQRAFSAAGIPSRREPSDISRPGGKRPDGMTLSPWSFGHALIWDATIPDTLAASYRQVGLSSSSKAVANLVESKKSLKYASFCGMFTPVGIEFLGAIGSTQVT